RRVSLTRQPIPPLAEVLPDAQVSARLLLPERDLKRHGRYHRSGPGSETPGGHLQRLPLISSGRYPAPRAANPPPRERTLDCLLVLSCHRPRSGPAGFRPGDAAHEEEG